MYFIIFSVRLSYCNDEYQLDVTKTNKNSEATRRLITKDGIRQATVAMIRTLISLAQTLSPIPSSIVSLIHFGINCSLI